MHEITVGATLVIVTGVLIGTIRELSVIKTNGDNPSNENRDQAKT